MFVFFFCHTFNMFIICEVHSLMWIFRSFSFIWWSLFVVVVVVVVMFCRIMHVLTVTNMILRKHFQQIWFPHIPKKIIRKINMDPVFSDVISHQHTGKQARIKYNNHSRKFTSVVFYAWVITRILQSNFAFRNRHRKWKCVFWLLVHQSQYLAWLILDTLFRCRRKPIPNDVVRFYSPLSQHSSNKPN